MGWKWEWDRKIHFRTSLLSITRYILDHYSVVNFSLSLKRVYCILGKFYKFVSIYCYNKRKYCVKKTLQSKSSDLKEFKHRFCYFHNILQSKKKECETYEMEIDRFFAHKRLYHLYIN